MTNLILSRDGLVLRVEGDVDLAATDALRSNVEAAVRGTTTDLVIDLSGAGFMDSSALSVLLWARRCVLPRGGRVHLVVTGSVIERLLQVTSLEHLFAVHGALDEAIAAAEDASV